MKFIVTFLVSIFALNFSFSQSILINEVMSSNSLFVDDDGHYNDWIELYNASSETISLKSWYISDDKENLKNGNFLTDKLKQVSIF